MQIVLIAILVIAIAVGLIFFMGKKKKAMMAKPMQESQNRPVQPPPQSSQSTPQ